VTAGLASGAQTDTAIIDNPEMKAIFDADQGGRKTEAIDWKTVAAADVKRQARTRELLAQNLLHTGQDYWEAAVVFQHGDTSNSYLLAHVLAMVALAKGKQDAISMASATLDRYLMNIGQKQIFGTQFVSPDMTGGWTQEPYDRELVSDALRQQLNVGTQTEQTERLKDIQNRK
jgi:endo-1,4-beta-D-glucanase Y